MHIGTQLMTFGTSAQDYFTPWFPKGADNAVFTYEIIRGSLGTGSPAGSFSISVYTKNREDVGSQGTAVSGSWSEVGSGTDVYEFTAEDLRELVRFKVTIQGGGTPPSGQEGVVYRFLPPTWYDRAV